MLNKDDLRWKSALVTTVNKTYTPVRSGPGVTHPIVTKITAEPQLARIMLPEDDSKDWAQIALNVNGTLRTDLWVHRDFIVVAFIEEKPDYEYIPLPEMRLDPEDKERMALIFEWLAAVIRS